MNRTIYILILCSMAISSVAMEKRSPLAAYTLDQLSIDPIQPIQNPKVHSFETRMVGYSLDPLWHDDFIVIDLYNVISLEINPFDGLPLNLDFEVSVTFNIRHFSFPEGTVTDKEQTLTVNYKKDGHEKFKKVDLVKLTGGQRVIITITDIHFPRLPGSVQTNQVLKKVVLSAYTEDIRYYKINTFSQIDCASLVFQNNNYPEIEMHWDPLPFAEEYDIELVHNDQYGGVNSPSSSTLSPFNNTYTNDQDDFYAHSTRITTKENSLILPLINELSKYRIRIRPIGRQGKDFNNRYEHAWSCDQYIQYTNQPHTDDQLNYQTIATYAEEAKYKIVNEYFDGRMAGRQKVTRLQSNNYALVQESIYDGIGRKAIEVLPGPVKNGQLDFYPGFNKNMLGDPYGFIDFEPSGLDCVSPPQPMSQRSGTSFYYSDEHYNSLTAVEKNSELKLIPHAFGYPFSQTRFMNDNTNRPISQGGVGKDHIIGSTHETDISYVYPTQSELDRLFGTEVGFAKYYKKIVTEDPNNQVSFAYQDLKGNTIATSLWGGVANLDTLETYKANTFTDDLTSYSKIDSLSHQIYTEYAFMVADDQAEYNFQYEMVGAFFDDAKCNLNDICYDCIYDIEIYLVNTDCNDTLFQESERIGSIADLDQICQGLDWSSQLKSIQLRKGNHTIRVALTVNEDAATAYVSDYINDPENQCIKHLSDFEEDYLAEIPDIPCHFNCEEFESIVIELEARIDKAKGILAGPVGIDQVQELRLQINQWTAEIEAWKDICDSDLNFCEQARLRMLSDLSPFGQYATLSVDTVSWTYSGGDDLSIFTPNNALADNGEAFYLNTQFSYPYINAQGEQINLRDLLVAESITLGELVNNYWQDEWSEQFLPFHPEYCYLEMCNDGSAEFDKNLMNVHTAAQAIDDGYVLPNGMGSPNMMLTDDPYDTEDIFDPQFQSGGLLYAELGLMSAEVDNYFINYPPFVNAPNVTLYDIAVATVCQSLQVDYGQYGNGPNPITNCTSVMSFDYPDQEIADRLWDAYRGLYLSLKQKYEYLKRTDLAIDAGCYNGCIGQDFFNQIRNGFYPHRNEQDICHPSNYDLYAEKNKVFPGPYDVPGLDSIDNIYDYENMDEIINHLFHFIEVQTLDSTNCGLSGELPHFPLDDGSTIKGEKCITYACLDELPGFFSQFINTNGRSSEFEILPAQEVDVPACFGLSPFLAYQWIDVSVTTDGASIVGTIGIEGLDPNACQITLQFPLDQFTDPNEVGSYIAGIDDFLTIQLYPDQLDQNGETNEFAGLAHSSFGGGMNVQFRGMISCAVLGRCCKDGVDEAIEACVNIPNVDDPQTIEEELWLGESNPYFDPAWIKNPCDITDTVGMDTVIIICIGDTAELCCPDTIIPGVIIPDNCEQERIDLALFNALIAYQHYIRDKKEEIKDAYMLACLNATQRFLVEHTSSEHHFVLSYYDQSGNLTRTVPPNGTYDYYDKFPDPDQTFQTQTELDEVTLARALEHTEKPDYSIWDTRYTYNSLNQITSQNLPDHGTATPSGQTPSRDGVSRFIFDDFGRLMYSQNPEQLVKNKYSYTKYDEIGRVSESGQWHHENVKIQQQGVHLVDQNQYMEGIMNVPGGKREQIVHTYYDRGTQDPDFLAKFSDKKQNNLRNRVAYAAYYETENDLKSSNALSASFYSYDEIGNVHNLVQYLRNGFLKSINYEYDLVSGNVKKVWYQKGAEDQFIHRYHYDADNRITQVETSTDGLWWDRDARYFFYPHGPLARTELGGEEVQGLDHVYSIHGWIKGVNSVSLRPDRDPGLDGHQYNLNHAFAPDEMGYMLNYYDGDYVSISGSQDFEPDYSGTLLGLYNGNIRNMTTSIGHFIRENDEYGFVSNDYAYDQLNRIKEMRPWDDFTQLTNKWASPKKRISPTWKTNPYFTDYSYDGNGNILTLQRNGAPQQVDMDKFTYLYDRGNNQLTRVRDAVPSNNYPLNPSEPNAIYDHDGTFGIGHTYDRIGNMTQDLKGGLTIDWNVQGKVARIKDDNGIDNKTPSNREIKFQYDPLGNRVAKIVDSDATYYVRDAQGNVHSTYRRQISGKKRPDGTVPVTWESAYLYGSNRLGEYRSDHVMYEKFGSSLDDHVELDKPIYIDGLDEEDNNDVIITLGIGYFGFGGFLQKVDQSAFNFDLDTSIHQRSKRQYELTNHLGNVIVNLSDRRVVTASRPNVTLSVVEEANDYFPGGMLQPRRSYFNSDTSYRFKHQGQESDDEISGTGTNYFYKYRMSDARLNRFWSVDPLGQVFFHYSTYQFSGNKLIDHVELEGMQEVKPDIFSLDYQAKQIVRKAEAMGNQQYLKRYKVNRPSKNSLVEGVKAAEAWGDALQIPGSKYIITSTEDAMLTVISELAGKGIEYLFGYIFPNAAGYIVSGVGMTVGMILSPNSSVEAEFRVMFPDYNNFGAQYPVNGQDDDVTTRSSIVNPVIRQKMVKPTLVVDERPIKKMEILKPRLANPQKPDLNERSVINPASKEINKKKQRFRGKYLKRNGKPRKRIKKNRNLNQLK